MKPCEYDPRPLKGQPIGMFHCPLCGEMVIAGMAHPDYGAHMGGSIEHDGVTFYWDSHPVKRTIDEPPVA